MRGRRVPGGAVLGRVLSAAAVAVAGTPGRDRRRAARDEVGEEVVWECDATGRFTRASPQCLELLGYAPEEALSLSLFGVLHPDEHAAVAHLLSSGHGWRRRVFRCVTKDGAPVLLRSTAVARADGRGRSTGLLGASHLVEDAPTADAAATSAAVRRVLGSGALRTAFQPIVSLAEGRVLGAEALSRFAVAGDERTPEDWFTDAARVGLGVDLEVHAAVQALRLAPALPDGAYVAVNLSPATLLWQGLADVLADAPVPLSRIVVEVTEHSPVEDYEALDEALRPLRDRGLRLAVDDAGAGHATFRHVLRLAPDLIKLDRSLISGIDGDPALTALAGAVVAFAREVRAVVVAEGIERPEEATVLFGLGVDAAQGYLFSRPTTDARAWRDWDASRQRLLVGAGLLSAEPVPLPRPPRP